MRRRPTRYARWFGGLLSLMLVLGVIGSASPTRAAEASADRIKIMAGGRLEVRVSGFEDGEALTTWASSARGSVFPTESGGTDRDGRATISIAVKRFWEPGWWAITVRGQRTGRQAIATFEVEAAPPSGRLNVAPSSIGAGQTINFSGSGFRGDEAISIWATAPDGSTTALKEGRSRSTGEINFRWDVPSGAIGGTWAMTAYGRDSDVLLVTTFVVTR